MDPPWRISDLVVVVEVSVTSINYFDVVVGRVDLSGVTTDVDFKICDLTR